MEQLHVIGREIGVGDVRLTVFKSNARARRFYDKLGFVYLTPCWFFQGLIGSRYVIRCDDSEDDYVIMQKLV